MQLIRPALTLFLFLAILTGLAYPLAMTSVAQLIFPHQANGSLIQREGQVIGSELIGQRFTRPEYFHPRPSAAGAGYDASSSGGSNLAPSNRALIDAIGQRTDAAARDSGGRPVPIDLVTASGSGLDPHISPRSALLQVSRVARTRQLPEDQVRALVEQHVEQPEFDVLGQPRVNVLALNLALDALSKRHYPR